MKPRNLICSATIFAVVVASAVRGYYLLGTTVAIVFGLMAAAVLFVVWRIFSTPRRFQHIQKTIILIFSALVFSIISVPQYFNANLNYFIENQRIERLTQAQLKTVFESDPKFSKLHFSCAFTKCIVVQVYGQINSQSDLRDLRSRVFETCPNVSSRWLFWHLTIKDANMTYDGKCDIDFFPDWGGREYPGNKNIDNRERP
jgi:hypothetical protein